MAKVKIIYTGIIGIYPLRGLGKKIRSLVLLAPNGEEHEHEHEHEHVCWLGCHKDHIEDYHIFSPTEISGCPSDRRAFRIKGKMKSVGGGPSGDLETWAAGKDEAQLLKLHKSSNNPYVASLDPKHVAPHWFKDELRLRTYITSGAFDIGYIDPKFEWSFSHHDKFQPLAQQVYHHFELDGSELVVEWSGSPSLGVEGRRPICGVRSGPASSGEG